MTGFRVKEFATIRMNVADTGVARDWYAKFFGLAPFEDLPNFVSFKIAGTCFDIAKADEKSPLSKGGSVGYWLVDDLDRAIAHAIKLGAKVYRGPLRIPDISRTIVQIEDPQGNVFGLEEVTR